MAVTKNTDTTPDVLDEKKQMKKEEEQGNDHEDEGPIMVDLNKSLRGIESSVNAPGVQTFENQYMAFASGFKYQVKEVPAYRSTKAYHVNPTAAMTDDLSYYYTLDNGKVNPASSAANPDTYREFVRNTKTSSHGGVWRRLMRPLE